MPSSAKTPEHFVDDFRLGNPIDVADDNLGFCHITHLDCLKAQAGGGQSLRFRFMASSIDSLNAS
jgi:hypothetical protein